VVFITVAVLCALLELANPPTTPLALSLLKTNDEKKDEKKEEKRDKKKEEKKDGEKKRKRKSIVTEGREKREEELGRNKERVQDRIEEEEGRKE
jgi:hypothetical protein